MTTLEVCNQCATASSFCVCNALEICFFCEFEECECANVDTPLKEPYYPDFRTEHDETL